MRLSVHFFLILSLVLNLLAPYVGYLTGSTNQQLICSTTADNWSTFEQNNNAFIKTGLALGFTSEQIEQFGYSNARAIASESSTSSKYHSGHCPLCSFEPTDTDIIINQFSVSIFTFKSEVNQPHQNADRFQVAFFLPINKAPPSSSLFFS